MAFCQASFSQGDLLVTPTRVVFEGNKQKEPLYLANVGADTATYSVSFLQYRQTEDGGYTTIEKADSGQMFAEPYLRIYPRTITLAPQESQSLILNVRRTADMPEGEYRSHLYFRSEKNYKPLDNKKNDTMKTLSVKLIPIYGISIPIIIRNGNLQARTTLSDLQIVFEADSSVSLKLTINRIGNKSVNGDFSVEYTPTQGKPYEIGMVKSVSVYTNINKRYFAIKLNKTPGLTLKNGKIKVTYTNAEEAKKGEVLATGELDLK